MAIQLAIAHDLSPAYPIAIHLQSIKNSCENVEDPEMTEFKSQQMENYLVDVLDIVPEEYMSELAQYLIVCEIDLSDVIKTKLIELKQVSHVVGCYLTE